MNDRIRELRKTADDMFHDELLKNNEARWHAYVSLSSEEENRIDEIFAKLIIEECLTSVYNEVQIIATHKEAKYITEKLKTKYDIQ